MPEKQPLIMMQPTEFFWTNNNGHRLHIRRVEHPKPKALLVYCHGYGCHMNAPRVWDKLCHYSEQLEVDIITFDMQGHGYSEGARALVPSFDDLAADVADFVNLLHAAATPTCESYNLCSSTSLKQMQHLPFTLCGESMGAAVAILASLHLPRLHSSNRFLGLILAAPGIQDPATGKGPTFLARGFSSVLRQAPTLGSLGVPKSFTPAIHGAALFCEEEDIDFFDRDHSGAETQSLGLAHARMKAQTAAAFVEMFRSMPTRLQQVDIPLIIFHDPEDAVTVFDNSKLIMQEAASTDKTLVPVPGGLHCPHFNRDSFVIPLIKDFLLRQLSMQVLTVRPSLRSRPSRPSGQSRAMSQTSSPRAIELQTAMSRWGAPMRTAPLLTLVLLLGHAGIVLSPFVALSVGTAGIYLLGSLVGVLLLIGAYIVTAAAWSACRIRAICGGTAENSKVHSDCLHLVCVPVYKEPDEMVLATIARLNEATQAPRMRVIFAMEAATDRAEERFKLYRQCLSRVPEVQYYVHPVGATPGEIRGLCSNLAFALSCDIIQLDRKRLGMYVLTKLDSQVLLPQNYFEQLELSFEREDRVSPVVWQPQLVSLLNRDLSHGPLRALGAMRTFCYPAFFALNVFTVTCYSIPLQQYIDMGLHHPSYMGEDWMVLAQSAVSSACGDAEVVALPVMAYVAPPLDSSLIKALGEGTRQCVRWAAQSMEVAEFRWRFRGTGFRNTYRSLRWILKYWLLRMVVANGLGFFAISLSIATMVFSPDFPDDEAVILLVLNNVVQATVLSLVVVMPLYEQYLASLTMDADAKAPLRQLPMTIMAGPPWLFFQMAVDYAAWFKFLSLGKAAITLTHRKKQQRAASPAKQVAVASASSPYEGDVAITADCLSV